MYYAVCFGLDTLYTLHYEVFTGGGYYLNYALRSIFGSWILFILHTTQYFREVDTIYSMYYAFFWKLDTIYTMHHVVFPWVDTIVTMYYAIFFGLDTVYTKYYAVFSGSGYYLYYALRSTFWSRYYL